MVFSLYESLYDLFMGFTILFESITFSSSKKKYSEFFISVFLIESIFISSLKNNNLISKKVLSAILSQSIFANDFN